MYALTDTSYMDTDLHTHMGAHIGVHIGAHTGAHMGLCMMLTDRFSHVDRLVDISLLTDSLTWNIQRGREG